MIEELLPFSAGLHARDAASGAERYPVGSTRRGVDDSSRQLFDAHGTGQLLQEIEILSRSTTVHAADLHIGGRATGHGAAHRMKGIG